MIMGARRRERSADELLIRRLYQEHGGALLAYATRLMGDRALGEDVVQETLIRAWRNPDALTNDKGSVRGYLFTITATSPSTRIGPARSGGPRSASPSGAHRRKDHATRSSTPWSSSPR